MKKEIIIIGVLIFSLVFTGCSSNPTIEATKTPFPNLDEVDMQGNKITNEIFEDYDVTIVNFWSNTCGTCIEEMPELEEYYHELSKGNINLIGVGIDSGESEKALAFAKKILEQKGVTYTNISPNTNNIFYKDFIASISGYPMTYVVDREGNIIGSPIVGNVKRQNETLQNRIKYILENS